MKKILVFAFALLSFANAHGEAEKVRSFQVTPSVQGTEYRLPNGLSVFLAVNKKAPLTSVYHWVKAGSLHETKGITGITHLSEHMMFRPLAEGKSGFFELLKQLGGTANANTRFAATVYTSTVPTENLQKLLQLEADRFTKLSVTDALLDVERKAVWSEYSTKFDANPVIDLWYALFHFGFPGHPYGWTIIGDREDLEKIKAADCNRFFAIYYRPNNIGLFIAGNFAPEQVIKWVEQSYGKWERGEDSKLPDDFVAEKKTFRGEGKLPSPARNVLLGYRIPKYNGKNHHIMDLSAHILFGSNSSLAKKRLVYQKRLASEAGDFNTGYDSGMLEAILTLLPSTSIDDALKEVGELKKDFAQMSDEEFNAYKREYAIGVRESGLRNESLNQYLALSWGKWGSIDIVTEILRQDPAVTKAEITEFVQKIIVPENLVAVTNKGVK